MRPNISFLTQSRYYSPAFNAAIFDGPVRIYFAQYQEPMALKVYFNLQNKLKNIFDSVREAYRRTGINIFIMLYPSNETFQLSFAESLPETVIAVERLGVDFVLGVRGPLDDEELEKIYVQVERVARSIADTVPGPILAQPAIEEAGI